MRIRKPFKFENAHIVRNCRSERCKSFVNPTVTMQVQAGTA